MKIKDRMTHPVEFIAPDASIREAALKMLTLNIGCLPVCEGDRLVGILTDRDIVLRSTSEARDPAFDTVRRCMTHEVEWCYEDESIEMVAQKMERYQIRRMPVLTYDQEVTGIVSLGDLAVRGERRLACEIFEKVSEFPHSR